mmetsp:Transcript_9590/g.18078  ORF Transcript_9590/g.18078 Transcript_9590/m.18078 type:complete len:223 (-) Transcript_9590:230-898(-)
MSTTSTFERLLVNIVIGILAAPAFADFRPGDFIPSSRKGQFLGTRTQWHDLIGRHCPRFAMDRTVVLPIPRPVGLVGNEEYKLSFSFEGERHITPWLTVLPAADKMDPSKPMLIHIHMGHDSSHIRKVKAGMEPVPAAYAKSHHEELRQLYNTSHWPKHVLLQYTWYEQVEVDTNRGLVVLLGGGMVASAIMLYTILRSHFQYISSFVSYAIAEEEEEEKDE